MATSSVLISAFHPFPFPILVTVPIADSIDLFLYVSSALFGFSLSPYVDRDGRISSAHMKDI